MWKRSTIWLAAVLALVAGACGGGQDVSQDPRQALQDAFEDMAEWDGAEFTLALDTDVASLMAADDTGELTEEQAQAIVDGRVFVKAFAGDLEDTSDDEVELLVESGDTVFGHLIVIGTSEAYVRSEVNELINRFGDTDAAADLNEAASQASQFGIDFAEEFFAGEWLQLSGLEQINNMMQGMAGVETPEPSELESLREELTAAFERFLDQVEVEYVGSEDPGEHVTVVATAQQATEMFVDIFELMSGFLPAQSGMSPEDVLGELRSELDSLPDVSIPIEFWLADGTVSRVGFDVVGFAERNPDLGEMDVPAGVDRLSIVADLSDFGGGVETPGDTIEVDLFELFGRMMGGGLEGMPDA